MIVDKEHARDLLVAGDLRTLFVDALGWDRHTATLEVPLAGDTHNLLALAQKRGMVAWHCRQPHGELLPDYAQRRKIERHVAKSAHEHLIVFTDATNEIQIWQWVKREQGKPAACREHTFHRSQPGDALLQKLGPIAFTLEQEDGLSLSDVTRGAQAGFDVERVTKRFYDQFQKEHAAFLKDIAGIAEITDCEWYASLILNRLMFIYFIQRKGFLDGDRDYLRNRLDRTRKEHGKDKFYSFYRHFLLRLFHEGLGGKARTPELEGLVGNIPYLNGGLFDVHELEKADRYGTTIQIPDSAFERVFDYFDQYQWHLDERPLRSDNEINPDVLGYIFEKYINQKQMGAYYTKEDITEYISKNTVLPFLFESARAQCKVAFENAKGLTVWDLLKDDPDRYVYSAVSHGAGESFPANIAAGINPPSLHKAVSDGPIKTPELRRGWNKSAPATHALPTETWREVIARRRRCEALKTKLAAGEVRDINDLITLNLDIRQFAQDAIENCEGPDLLRAFWNVIEKITILDPTCGSGAFLFAALNILEPLYEACLDRMEAFVEDLARSEEKHRQEKYSDFWEVLDSVAAHPNRRYFIFKSIILNNLFGVDIMEEAVEICKLRLFLKLAAQVEPDAARENMGIEPLPDIDFNIRAGNTLVGYATLDAVKQVVGSKLDFDNAAEKIAVRAADLQHAFDAFRARQVGGDGAVPAEAKLELRRRLKALDDELDHYLAGEYGVNPNARQEYASWLKSHQPFHWCVEFYGIVKSGGFDVIIGNPPYVEVRNVTTYSVKGYATTDCGDLYNLCLERSIELARQNGTLGFIVPLSAFSVGRFKSFQQFYYANSEALWVSHWSGDAHPAKLFEGVNKRLQIVLTRRRTAARCRVFTSKYLKWYSEERATLFASRLFYSDLQSGENLQFFDAAITKIQADIARNVLRKIHAQPLTIELLTSKTGRYRLYYTRKVSFFLQFLDFVPGKWDSEGRKTEPSELKALQFSAQRDRDIALSCLSSSLFYWFNVVNSDCRNLNKREVIGFRLPRFPDAEAGVFAQVLRRLMVSYKDNSTCRTVCYKGVGNVTVQYFNFRPSKSILDEIDKTLARHYGFTEEELDFIINYDIKYRLGAGTTGGNSS
ncbi:Eco57I restriction-modification methylase domain-containing protein [Gemmatimonadota bacterium]